MGVAVLIIVTSVFSGFHLQLKKTFFQFSADIQVRQITVIEEDGLQKWLSVPMDNYDELTNLIPVMSSTLSFSRITGALLVVGFLVSVI